jgi:DNA polymerase III subunit gamma/tau
MSLYQKYRPQKFADLVGEDHVRDTLLSAITESRIGHAYLFAGPRGTGKTSAARLLAKAMNCSERAEKQGESCDKCRFCLEISENRNLDIIEIDAASNRGIDEIRELREKIKFAPSSGKYKVFIIDEVHMLTLPAFNALLKTLEEPPKHAIFILATPEAHKIPTTVLSRVQRFDFRRVNKNDIKKNLKQIAKSEEIKVTDESLETIAVAAEGSHRDSISLLEQVASLTRDIKISDVRHVLGLARDEEVLNIIEKVFSNSTDSAIKISAELISGGVDPGQVIKEITESLRQLLLYKISNGQIDFEITKDREEKLKKLSESMSAKSINRVLSIFIESGRLIKETSIRSLPLEMAIVESSLLEVKTAISEKAEEVGPAQREKPEIPGPPEEKKAEVAKREEVSGETVVKTKEKAEILEFSDENWQKVLAGMKNENHSLSALLRDAYPVGVEGDQLIIDVKFKFHLDKISENRNCQLVENVLEKVVGKKYGVVCRIAGKKSGNKVAKKTGEDLESVAKEIFETEE